jgi:hypothetical protein
MRMQIGIGHNFLLRWGSAGRRLDGHAFNETGFIIGCVRNRSTN